MDLHVGWAGQDVHHRVRHVHSLTNTPHGSKSSGKLGGGGGVE